MSAVQKIVGPTVWTGPELLADSSWRIELEPAHVAELLAAAERVADRPMTDVTRNDFELPTLAPVLARALDKVLYGSGLVLLSGVPVDQLPEPDLKRVYWGIGLHLGIPIPQNDAGDYLVQIRDEGLDFSNPVVRGYQTSVKLDYHSDSTDLVALLCLRPAKEGGVSTVVSASAVFNEAINRRPDLVDVLMAPWWRDRRKQDMAASFFQCRIFGLEDGTFTSYYGRQYIESATRSPDVPPLNERQVEALDLIDSVANDPEIHLGMDFRPGDIQVLNNYQIWHSRTDYVDYPEPERRRELYRLWLTVRDELNLPSDFEAAGITNRSVAFGSER